MRKPKLILGHASDCKGVPHYYDGALGYEAMKCDVCGYELDLNAEANAKATAEREEDAYVEKCEEMLAKDYTPEERGE